MFASPVDTLVSVEGGEEGDMEGGDVWETILDEESQELGKLTRLV